MLSVGITGGIGSGKTTVCKFFEFLDVPVYYADERAKKLMTEDAELINGIKSAFGNQVYTSDGQLDRKLLAETVFGDEGKLKILNNLVHPAVWKDSEQWMQSHVEADYILYEAAILFESGSYKMFDKSITVYAPETLRISRVMKRDNVSRNEVIMRIENQMPDEEKLNLADYVIYNDEKKSILVQILELNQELIRISKGL